MRNIIVCVEGGKSRSGGERERKNKRSALYIGMNIKIHGPWKRAPVAAAASESAAPTGIFLSGHRLTGGQPTHKMPLYTRTLLSAWEFSAHHYNLHWIVIFQPWLYLQLEHCTPTRSHSIIERLKNTVHNLIEENICFIS